MGYGSHERHQWKKEYKTRISLQQQAKYMDHLNGRIDRLERKIWLLIIEQGALIFTLLAGVITLFVNS